MADASDEVAIADVLYSCSRTDPIFRKTFSENFPSRARRFDRQFPILHRISEGVSEFFHPSTPCSRVYTSLQLSRFPLADIFFSVISIDENFCHFFRKYSVEFFDFQFREGIWKIIGRRIFRRSGRHISHSIIF